MKFVVHQVVSQSALEVYAADGSASSTHTTWPLVMMNISVPHEPAPGVPHTRRAEGQVAEGLPNRKERLALTDETRGLSRPGVFYGSA